MAEISKAVGSGVEIKTSRTAHKGKWFGGSTSTSEARRPLLDPGDVRKMDMNETIVLITGTKPIRAKKIFWFKMPQFRRLGVDLHRNPDAPLVQNPRILAMAQKKV